MSKTLSNVTLQLKNGTAANWTTANPVLAKGELGLESDRAHFKFGDGITSWNDLDYAGTIVAASESNGHLIIDGTDIVVYSLPTANLTTLGGVKSQASGTGKIVVAADGTMSVGNVPTADALATARKISISGDATGNTSFNGGSDISIAIALVSSGVTAGTFTKLTVNSKGIVTAGTSLVATDIPTLTLSKISDAGTAASKNVGVASGNVPILDSNGKLDSSILPALAITNTFTVANQAAMLALTAQEGDIAIRTDGTGSWILTASPASTLANWKQLSAPTDLVTSVNGKTGAVTLTTGDIAEGTNLYWTTARGTANFNTNFANKTVGGLSDGSNVVMSGDTLVIDCGTVS